MLRFILPLILLSFISIDASSQDGKLKERIRNLKKVKMLDYLELEDAKADKLIVKFNSLEGQIDDATEKVQEAIEKLEDAVENDENSSTLRDLSNEVKMKTEQMLNMQKLKMDEIDKILDDEEFARYIVFEHNFRKELKSKLSNARGKRGKR